MTDDETALKLGNQGLLFAPPPLFRLESDIHDCEVEGSIPADLQGAFYRVGPDAQYPLHPNNIPFDGEGHVSTFRFKNGRVQYRSRYVKNERYLAQAEAGRGLFPLYRNPFEDDPSVKGLSRSTANTGVVFHNNLLLAMKEDGPPSALDPITLETLIPNYTFDGQLQSETFTAHPKIDSETGNLVAFGYEAKGLGSDDVSIVEFTPQGSLVWSAWIKVPYVGLLHDFAVTQRHIVFYVIPLAYDEPQMKRGGIHWSWDSEAPTYLGVMRRGGDGKDLRWFRGPERSATHVMGAFSDGDKVYLDMEMSLGNPFPFMPNRNGAAWDPMRGACQMTRLSVDLANRSTESYDTEMLYPGYLGGLPRQDDRFHTVPYRVGFLPCTVADPDDLGKRSGDRYARFDHDTRKVSTHDPGPDTLLSECCFVPRHANAREGEGYLLGVAARMNEGGRADLIILDAEHLTDGPIATVKLPVRSYMQVHGWWVPEAQLPDASPAQPAGVRA